MPSNRTVALPGGGTQGIGNRKTLNERAATGQ
jgi:hypothetical protein